MSGELAVKVTNQGLAPVLASSRVLVFLDRNANRVPDSADTILAEYSLNPMNTGEVRQLTMPISGQGFFPGNIVAVALDVDSQVPELDENNNYIDATPTCRVVRPEQGFQAELRWSWSGESVLMAPVVGDIDGDGVPEVVFTTLTDGDDYMCMYYSDNTGTIRVLDGRTGQEKCHINNAVGCRSSVALGDVDGDGVPEIVSRDRYHSAPVAFNHDCTRKWLGDSGFTGGIEAEADSVALADLDHDGRSEVIIGASVFDSNGRLRWRGKAGTGQQSSAGTSISIVADLDLDGVPEIIAGRTAYRADGQVYWDRAELSDGYTAVGNFDDDAFPEVVLVHGAHHAPAWVTLISHDGTVRWTADLPGGGSGGPPTVADMDGDGWPEIGVAGYQNYVVYNRDGHVLWQMPTQDRTSAITGSSVFDFDGDGSAEVVYGDEQYVWVFDGRTGTVVWRQPSVNGTWIDLPAIADVDGDGHAEIVRAAESYTFRLPPDQGGVRVYASPKRDWMNARKVWNQESYHITNVNDDLSIPVFETPSWQRTNTYRLNTVLNGCAGGRADLVASYMRVVPDPAGLRATVRVGNGGQSPVLSGLSVSFYADDPTSGGTLLTTVKTTTILSPGMFEDVPAVVPTTNRVIWAVADDVGGLHGEIAELDELNNYARQGGNMAPVVSAGDNQTVTMPAQAVLLNGSAHDDGLPLGSTLDVLWTQISGPASMTLASPHSPTTTASFGEPGDYRLQLQATDGVLTSTATVQITVLPAVVNQAPVVRIEGPTTVALPTGVAAFTGTVQDDGLPTGSAVQVAWTVVSGPGEVEFTQPTQAATSATFSALGTYVLELDATDGALNGSAKITVAVVPHNDAPVVSAGTSRTLAYPTRTTTLVGTASDDGQPTGCTLSLAWSTVSGPGAVTFSTPSLVTTGASFSYPGTYVLRLTASDCDLSSTSDVTVVVEPVAGAAPTVALTVPVDGASITAPTDAWGTVSGGDWKLEYRVGGEDSNAAWTTLSWGSGQVVWGRLGHLDPTLMLNGIYAIRLTSTTSQGQASVTNHVSIEKNLKVGNFTVSFNDVSVPMMGLPIEVIRTYDSRDKTVGDFGVGWNVSVRNLRVETSGTLGKGWQQVRQPGFWPQYCVSQARSRFVTVTFPTGKVYRFRSAVDPSCEMFTMVGMTAMAFDAEAGTRGTLTTTGGDGLIVADGTLLGADMQPFNPLRFELTTDDGMAYSVDKAKGLVWMQDRNGNTVNVSSAGLIHSAGKSIVFDRDSAGRISKVSDPAGNALTYAYDSEGNLISVTDRSGQQTTYTYNNQHGLLDITDPRGVRAIRNEYDAAGRLVKNVDANGKAIVYTHDLAGKMETITDRTGAQQVLRYDSDGNVVSQTDAEGGTITRTFDENDNRTSETDALGNKSRWTYDAAGNVTEAMDPLGKKTVYAYNAWNQVTSTTDPLGHVTTNAYDGNGNLLSTKDGFGYSTVFTYDRSGRQTSRTTRTGYASTYAHDTFGNLASETDGLGNPSAYTYDANGNRLTETRTRTKADGTRETLVTRFSYDKNGRLLATTQPDGSITRTTYDAAGQRATSTDALGRVTQYTYDDAGRLTGTTYPDGTTTSSTYDEEGRRLTSTDKAGRVTSMEYDGVGRLLSTTYADGSGTSTTYALNGRVQSSTDSGGHATSYEYDAAGRQTKVTDAAGKATAFTYDDSGNQLTVKDALGNVTTSVYDAGNRLVRTLFADNTSRSTTYDKEGQRTTETDQAGKTTSYGYDALGRLTKVTDALGQVTRYEYDEVGNRVKVIDAAGKETKYAYDKQGRETKRTLPDGSFETKAYDLAGQLVSRTDFQGRTTTYAYDAAGRLTGKSYPNSSTVGFAYGVTGRRTSATDARGTTTYAYDTRDRLTAMRYPDGRRLEYGYDNAGNKISLTAKVGSTTLTTTNDYDILDRIANVTDPDGRVFGMEYNDVGSLAKLVRPNGVDTAYTHDSLNRLTNIRTYGRASNTTIASYSYTLGATGIRTRIDEADGTARSYEYDDLYRLTKETVTGAQPYEKTFAYDAVSNRTRQTTSGDLLDGGTSSVDAGPLTSGTINYTYDNRDRLLTENGTVYSWNANGNLVGKTGEATYEWDFEDRLVKVTKADGTVVENVYDVDGVLVRTAVNGVGTDLLVDTSGGLSHVVAEVDSSGAVSVLYMRAGDMLLEEIRGGVAKMYEADGLGSVRGLLDSTGTRTDTYSYEAFGSTVSTTGSDANPYRFAGERLVDSVGFYQNRARWLDTRPGRFASVDPAEGEEDTPISFQPYLYGAANPVIYVDASGEFETLAGLMVTVGMYFGLESIVAAKEANAARASSMMIMVGTGPRLGNDGPIPAAYQAKVYRGITIAWNLGRNPTFLDVFRDAIGKLTGNRGLPREIYGSALNQEVIDLAETSRNPLAQQEVREDAEAMRKDKSYRPAPAFSTWDGNIWLREFRLKTGTAENIAADVMHEAAHIVGAPNDPLAEWGLDILHKTAGLPR
jgi:RHS repeat-associated protein